MNPEVRARLHTLPPARAVRDAMGSVDIGPFVVNHKNSSAGSRYWYVTRRGGDGSEIEDDRKGRDYFTYQGACRLAFRLWKRELAKGGNG